MLWYPDCNVKKEFTAQAPANIVNIKDTFLKAHHVCLGNTELCGEATSRVSE